MRFVLMLAVLLCCAPVLAAVPAGAPVMLIRFNQPSVAFEKPLADVVAKAKAIKPDVKFVLIHYVPASAPPEVGADLGAVVLELKALGVANDNITSERIPANVDTSEVHVFVG